MNQPVLTVSDFNLFRDLIYRDIGITLRDDKLEMVRGRLMKRIRARALKSFGEYYDLVKGGGASGHSKEEYTSFIDAICTNKTEFFREDAHFKYLQNEILPALGAKKNKSRNRQFRIWSAACSTGERPPSVPWT